MKHYKLNSYLYLAILALIWGSSFILMKKGLIVFPAPDVASLRIFFAGIIFLPFILKNFKEIPLSKIKYIIIFALLEIGIPPFLYTYAQEHIDSSSAGILNSLVPLFTLIVGLIVYKLKYHWLTIIGVFIGLFGAFAITFMNNANGDFINLSNGWGLLIVLATLFYAIAGHILNEHLNEVSSLMITAVAFVSMSIPASIYLLISKVNHFDFSQAKIVYGLSSIAILSVFGSALAIAMFSKLIKISNALFASFVTYLIPFVSFLWGWIDSENINIIHFSALLLIFLGIYLANIGEKRKKLSLG